jgi:hypothetical protein
MFYNDLAPSHFHARYGDYKIQIGSLCILAGSFPPSARGLLMNWAVQH